jgi:hypothetical protein
VFICNIGECYKCSILLLKGCQKSGLFLFFSVICGELDSYVSIMVFDHLDPFRVMLSGKLNR